MRVEPTTLVDAKTVGRYLGVKPDWVYANATLLRARRLGTGPKARLRFSLVEVDELLTSSKGRESDGAHPAQGAVKRRRRKRAGISGELLPIRGRIEAA